MQLESKIKELQDKLTVQAERPDVHVPQEVEDSEDDNEDDDDIPDDNQDDGSSYNTETEPESDDDEPLPEDENSKNVSMYGTSVRTEPKYIVFLSQLLELFRFCHYCKSDDPMVGAKQMGTEVTVTASCKNSSCLKEFIWHSQPLMTFKSGQKGAAGNFLLSMAILFAGSSATKVFQVFSNLALGCISLRTFFRHQKRYLFPVIYLHWQTYQAKLLEDIKNEGKDIVVSGDARHDSMGHNAKFGAYTICCCTTSKIIHFSLVQRNQAGSSNAMEYQGFQECMEFVLDIHSLPIVSLISDRHTSISAHMKRDLSHIMHYFDLWHLKKSSTAHDKMVSALTTNSLIKGIKQASPLEQTSSLGGFHSLVNQFAPKMIAFSYVGMYCRHILAILHFNSNLQREVKRKRDGTERLRISYPKFQNGQATIRNVCVEQKFDYVEDLFETYLASSKETINQACEELKEMTPRPMNSVLEKQPVAEAVEKRIARKSMVVDDVPPTMTRLQALQVQGPAEPRGNRAGARGNRAGARGNRAGTRGNTAGARGNRAGTRGKKGPGAKRGWRAAPKK